jgi:hypothetical protein
VTAGLRDAQGFAHDLGKPCRPAFPATFITIPRFAHKRDGSGRVGDNRIDGIIWQLLHHVQTIAMI